MVAPGRLIAQENEDDATIAVNQMPIKRRRSSIIKKRRRMVKFSSMVNVQLIPDRSEFTKEEIRDYFLSKLEQEQIRGDAKRCLKRMIQRSQNGNESPSADDEDEIRGLEKYTPEGSQERIESVRYAKAFILRQQQFAPADNEWLSRVYRTLSESSTKIALNRGLMDRQQDLSSPPFPQVMFR